jgi:hypothetical protein
MAHGIGHCGLRYATTRRIDEILYAQTQCDIVSFVSWYKNKKLNITITAPIIAVITGQI